MAQRGCDGIIGYKFARCISYATVMLQPPGGMVSALKKEKTNAAHLVAYIKSFLEFIEPSIEPVHPYRRIRMSGTAVQGVSISRHEWGVRCAEHSPSHREGSMVARVAVQSRGTHHEVTYLQLGRGTHHEVTYLQLGRGLTMR